MVALLTRFERSGQREDLNEAMSYHQHALDLFPGHHAYQESSFMLAAVLLMQFSESGLHQGIDDAISILRHVLQFTPAPHHSFYMGLLADMLHT